MRYKVQARPSPDYDPKVQRIPSWIVLVHRDGTLVNAKRFNGAEPKKDAQAYAKNLREDLRQRKAVK